MDQEVIEVTLRLTVDEGYPRENTPLEHQIRSFADEVSGLTGVRTLEARTSYPVDLPQSGPSLRQVRFN
jgi:hypothetical protein